MSVQVNLKGLPPHVLESVYNKSDPQKLLRSSGSGITSFSFPRSKVALWDPTPNGDVVSLHLSYYRNPKLVLVEKALRLAYRQARQSDKHQFSCFLLGALTVDDDEEGVTLTLDRFDPGREQHGCSVKAPTVLLPGDFIVPCTISTQGVASTDLVLHSADELSLSFKMLQHCCCSRETMELSRMLTLRAHVSCAEHLDMLTFGLHWAAVTVASTLDAVPMRPVPVIPTALARSLSNLASLAQPLQNTCRKQGFLTMDQTRKLLLILESDPKAYTLPLVGVWLSGVTHIHNPQVWAWCLRYLHSSSLHDKVMSEGGAFLVVLYSLTHRDPEFYQCQLGNGQQKMAFQLLTSTETLTLYKNAEISVRPLQFELSPENQESEFFKKVTSCVSFARSDEASSTISLQNKLSVSDHDSGVEDEELSPRPSPNPHPASEQTRRIHPSVPELSLVMDGSFLDGKKVPSHEHAIIQDPIATSALQRRANGLSHQLSSASKSSDPATVFTGPPPIRRPPIPAPGTLLPNASKGPHTSAGQQHTRISTGRKSASPAERSSTGDFSQSPANSAPSLSTTPLPKTTCSSNTPTNQLRQPSTPPALSHRGLSPITPHLPQSSPAPPLSSGHSHPRHSSSSLSLGPAFPHQLKNFHSTPCPNPSAGTECVGLPCSCCAHQHGHTPVYHASGWSGVPTGPVTQRLSTGSPGVLCCPASDSVPRPDCCTSPSCQAHGYRSTPHCSHAQCSPSHDSCSPIRDHGPLARWPVEQGALMCQAPCCQGTYPDLSSGQPHTAVNGPVGILPADAYRILVDQDRQLKLLHAQIKRLLEAQGKDMTPPRQAPPCEEQDSTCTPVKKCVSIAVSTGASLFLGSPRGATLTEPESRTQAESASGFSSPEEDRAPSSLNSSTHKRERERRAFDKDAHNCLPAIGPQAFQSPVLGESASMYYQCQSPVKLSPPAQEPRAAEDEQRFYQLLMGQVANRLQASDGEEEQPHTAVVRSPSERRSLTPQETLPDKSPPGAAQVKSPKKACRPRQSKQDDVLQATLRQLQQLGVNVDLDSALQGRAMHSTVESASTLACINPEAVVPRLALSEPVGTSMWGPSGSVDLSLEANAIALKYLSDSHLSRLSLGDRLAAHGSSAVLSRKAPTESTGGFSILSSSNMSFATRKYMKRYGLMEGGEGSEDEEVGRDERRDSALGHSAETDLSEDFGQEEILKNITNRQTRSGPVCQRSAPLRSQSQLWPKVQQVSRSATKRPQKENESAAAARGLQPAWVETQMHRAAEGSLGNFLDLSRLRQLPKLL